LQAGLALSDPMMWSEGRVGLAGALRILRGAATILVLSLAGAALSQAPATTAANTDWLFLGNGPDMQHHAELGQINRVSVRKLGLAWAVDMPTPNGLVGNPLIKDGVIYQGGPFGQIYANDLKTGKQLWVFKADMPVAGTSFSNYIAYHMNRGIALSGDDVIIAANCDLIAVDQKTGKQRWQAQSCNSEEMYGITAAPRVGDGMVFTGNNCMDSGESRGFVDAFDAATGKHRWRFYTVPGDPAKPQDSPLYEGAAKTWGTDWYAKSKGCGSVWDSITFDPVLHQVYIGVGGASAAGKSMKTLHQINMNSKSGLVIQCFCCWIHLIKFQNKM
jgi:quinohemoprotein ethanol dehydrogenase